MGGDALLTIDGLSGGFRDAAGVYRPVLRNVSLSAERGVTTAIVGETGSGKTLTALSIVGLTPPRFEQTGGSITFDGALLDTSDERALRSIRGTGIAVVFQNPRTAINPVFRIGKQLGDIYRLHHGVDRATARAESIEMLQRVQVPQPAERLRQYPHELSGGTAQRVQLAMALACRPRLLVLDEPTTGLDATIQADVLDLIVDLNRELGMTALMITHDLGVVAETCDAVVVMRDGEVREIGSCEQILTEPGDEYTRQLLAASRVETERA